MIIKTEAVKKWAAVDAAIRRTAKSVDEISVFASVTLSLTDLKKKLKELRNSEGITEAEFDAIFSDETINELRPYKGKLVGLDDTEMGIVSKDYICDVISYIIGVVLPSASTGVAWDRAERFVNDP